MILTHHCLFLLLLPTFSLALPHRLRHLVEKRPQGKGLDIPVQTRKNSESRPGLHRRSGVTGSVGLGDDADLLYTIPIQLGSTTTAVDLDTGSSDLWVISNACESAQCKNSTATPYELSSLTPSNATVVMYYGDSNTGTFASGPIGTDMATLAGISVPNQQFAAISNTTSPTILYGNTAGIFGLGFPSESQVQSSVVDYQYNKPATTDDFISTMSANGPLLSRMALSGDLDQPMFAITLQRDTVDVSGTGTLSIGKLPDGVDNSSLTWVPVRLYNSADGGMSPPTFAPNEVYPYRWEVEIDGVYLDGKQLAKSTIPGQGINSTAVSALIDTGNSILRGPADVVNNILTSVSPSFAASSGKNAATLPCSTSHNLTFQIGGQMFPIDPRDFISPGEGDSALTCVADNVVSTDPPSVGALYSWSLGDPFLKSNLVAFYYGNLTHPSVDPPRIGFMSMVSSNASQILTNVVQDAQEDGDVFESTSQIAPTAGIAPATTTLSMPSVSIIGTASSSPEAPSTPATQVKSSALSALISHSGRVWVIASVSLVFLFCGI